MLLIVAPASLPEPYLQVGWTLGKHLVCDEKIRISNTLCSLRHGRPSAGHPRRGAPQSVESDRKPAVQPGVDPRHKAGDDVPAGSTLNLWDMVSAKKR